MSAAPTPARGSASGGRGARLRAELVLLGGLALVALAQLDLAPVVTMEGIVGAGARHMLREGSWAVPQLYGELYTFKPPLAYWLVAASFQLLGETVLALRLPFALMAVLGPWIGARVLAPVIGFQRAAWAAFAGATGVLTMQKVRIAEFDGLLAAGLGVAILASAVQLAAPVSSPRRWLLVGAGFTVGFLAKGAPAVGFFVPGLLAAAWATGGLRRLVQPMACLAWALSLAAIGAWALMAWQDAGAAAFAQPLAEGSERAAAWSVERLLTALTAPLAVLLLFAPWSLALPLVRIQGDDQERALRRALLAFVVAGTVVFMLVPRTSLRYLLPLAAPIGALVALQLTGPPAGRIRLRALGLLSPITGGLGLAAALGAFGTHLPPSARALCLLLSLPALALTARSLRQRRWLPEGSLGAASLASCALALCGAVAYGTDLRRAERRSMVGTASELAPLLAEGEVLHVDWFDTHSNLHFLLDHPWRRFEVDGSWPDAGQLVLLTLRQADAASAGAAPPLEELVRTTSGRTRFLLARVLHEGVPVPSEER